MLNAEQRGQRVSWDRLLFSAKESVYKAWFPLTRRWLSFEDVSISIDPASEAFTARLNVTGPALAGGPLDRFTGRWQARGGLIATAVTLTRAGDFRIIGKSEPEDQAAIPFGSHERQQIGRTRSCRTVSDS